jgi:hypothetical protein
MKRMLGCSGVYWSRKTTLIGIEDMPTCLAKALYPTGELLFWVILPFAVPKRVFIFN